MKDDAAELPADDHRDIVLRWTTTASVVVVTAIAAVISYGHARELVLRYGVTGWTASFMPLTVDGLVATCSLILVDCARHDQDAPWHAWVLLFAGACATVAANVAAGLSHGVIGAIIAGWPAFVACGCFELLLRHRRRPARRRSAAFAFPAPALSADRTCHQPADLAATRSGSRRPGQDPSADPVVDLARRHYAADLAAGNPPSIRAIKRELHVGTARATIVRSALAGERAA